MTTTNHQRWIDSLQEGGIQSMAQLHRAVDTETNFGIFTVRRDDTGLYVRARGHEMTLHIKTEVAKTTFLEMLEREFRPGKLEAAIAALS